MPNLPLAESPPVAPIEPPDLSQLDELELRIARRADQLAAGCALPTPLNLRCWLEAELEVLREVLPPLHAPRRSAG